MMGDYVYSPMCWAPELIQITKDGVRSNVLNGPICPSCILSAEAKSQNGCNNIPSQLFLRRPLRLLVWNKVSNMEIKKETKEGVNDTCFYCHYGPR